MWAKHGNLTAGYPGRSCVPVAPAAVGRPSAGFWVRRQSRCALLKVFRVHKLKTATPISRLTPEYHNLVHNVVEALQANQRRASDATGRARSFSCERTGPASKKRLRMAWRKIGYLPDHHSASQWSDFSLQWPTTWTRSSATLTRFVERGVEKGGPSAKRCERSILAAWPLQRKHLTIVPLNDGLANSQSYAHAMRRRFF